MERFKQKKMTESKERIKKRIKQRMSVNATTGTLTSQGGVKPEGVEPGAKESLQGVT
jgi:hypothetical protein